MEKPTKTAKQLLARKSAGVVAVAPDATVLSALKVLAEKDIGALLVLQGDKLVGILSERDYARKVELKGKTANTPVREIMTENVISVTPDQTADQCMALMKQKRIRHLPVVEGARVIGILSTRDVLEEVIAEDEHLINDLKHERVEALGDTGGTY